MINFVIKENKGLEVIGQIRKMVTVSTSLVLIIYIVVAGGMTGWTAWVSMRQKQTFADSSELIRQVSSMFDTEVVVRNLADRANMVEDFLQNRGNASDAANMVRKDGFTIFEWDYLADGAETVGVSASAPAQLKEYSDYLKTGYSKVQISRIEWNPDKGWTGMFIISGRMKT